DRAGHAVGDSLLCDVAEGLSEVIRGGDVIGRLGGDEFVLLMEYRRWPEEPVTVATRVLSRLSLRVLIAGGTTPVAPSIGIAAFPDDGGEAGALLAKAGLAMYEAKRRRGGRQSCFFNQSIAQAARQRGLLLEEV